MPVDRKRRPPVIAPEPPRPRTDTLDKLKEEVGIYTKTVERHDEAIEKWLRPIATELPAQLATLRESITKLDATVNGAAAAMGAFADETRRNLRELDDRMTAAESRGADHAEKWLLLDAESLPPRVAALEERKRTEETTAKIETALVAQQRKYLGFIVRHIWKGLVLVESALLAYLGLS